MIISDADFLSSFIKISALELVFKALGTDKITITAGVLNELEQAPFREKLHFWLTATEFKLVVEKIDKIYFSEEFGRGELESIYLAERTNSLLLTNDRNAGILAERKGITVMDIVTFLIYCKKHNLLSNDELGKIIRDLKEKDYYEFSEEVKEILLG